MCTKCIEERGNHLEQRCGQMQNILDQPVVVDGRELALEVDEHLVYGLAFVLVRAGRSSVTLQNESVVGAYTRVHDPTEGRWHERQEHHAHISGRQLRRERHGFESLIALRRKGMVIGMALSLREYIRG